MRMILACDINGGIGKDNDLLVHIPEDLKTFKKYTTDKTVVMGANTWHSLNFKLPNRTNIVLSDTTINKLDSGQLPDIIFSNMSALEEYLETLDDAVIIGGGSMYRYFLDKVDEVSLSLIDAELEADVFFPLGKMFTPDWKIKSVNDIYDKTSGLTFFVHTFERAVKIK